MKKLITILFAVVLGLNANAQTVSLPCDTTNCSLLKYDGNDDGMVNYEDFLEMLGAYGSADVDGDCIEDSQDDCVEDECGVCDGPGPTIQVVDTIVFISDSTFIEVLNEWYVFEVPDTTFTFVCTNPGCANPEAENYDPFASEDDGSCIGTLNPCSDGSIFLFFNGYSYDLIGIGDQCWFAENLRNEHYANGDAIPGGLSDSEWFNAVDTNLGAQAINENPAPNLTDYGRLYNWYAVDDARGLCPSGWHVPTDGEFMTLEMELGMSESEVNSTGWRGTDQGAQMKSSADDTPSWDGTNTSGFSGLAGGNRSPNGAFTETGYFGYFWSASADGTNSWYRNLAYVPYDGVYRNVTGQRYGMSVRCVRD